MLDLSACLHSPLSPSCERTKKFFRDLLEAMYLSRVLPNIRIPLPPLPGPDPSPLAGDPSPQPSIVALFENQQYLIGELLMNALRDPTPTPMINDIKKSGLQLEVAKGLQQRFKSAVKIMDKEIKQLENTGNFRTTTRQKPAK